MGLNVTKMVKRVIMTNAVCIVVRVSVDNFITLLPSESCLWFLF